MAQTSGSGRRREQIAAARAKLRQRLPQVGIRPAAVAVALAFVGYASLLASRAEDAPYPEAPGSSGWTGPYAGAVAGFGFGQSSSSQTAILNGTVNLIPPVAPTSSSPGGLGYMLGGEVGYRWQAGPIVLGTAADFSFGSAGGSASQSGSYNGGPYNATQKSSLDWLATVRGTAGVVPVENMLLYATAGFGLGGITNSSSIEFPSEQFSGSRSMIQPGWVAGMGVEYKLDDYWSVKAQYLHEGFGASSNVSPSNQLNGEQFQSKFAMQDDTFTLGFNYLFGAPAGGGSLSDAAEASYTAQYFSELNYSMGFRYWPSIGSMKYKLGAQSLPPQISELTYKGIGTNSGEIYWRAGHDGGGFVKGYAGLGVTGSGQLKDEDFPPYLTPYSATLSSQSAGSITYGAVDVGYDAFGGEGWRAGPFLGYGLFREQLNAYGCTQVATNPICGPGQISSSVAGISEDAAWNLFRVGLTGEVTLMPNLMLSADFAWIPVGGLAGTDNHWLRTDFTGPINQSGAVNGVQIDVALSYKLKDWLTVGAGARYWQFNANGTSTFQTIYGPSQQVTRFTTERYGPFVQVSVAM